MTDSPSRSRTFVRRGVLALFAFFVGFTGAVAAVRLSQGDERPSAQGTRLGPIDINTYCRTNHGPTAIAVLVRRDASGWQCAIRDNGIFGTARVDYERGCTEQYGQVAHGDSTSLSWPYLWQCIAGPAPTS